MYLLSKYYLFHPKNIILKTFNFLKVLSDIFLNKSKKELSYFQIYFNSNIIKFKNTYLNLIGIIILAAFSESPEGLSFLSTSIPVDVAGFLNSIWTLNGTKLSVIQSP